MRYPGNDPENGPAYDPRAKDKWGYPKYDEYGNRIYHRRDGVSYSGPRWRREKRLMSKEPITDPCYVAYQLGQHDGYFGKEYRNPYPPGKRHQNYHDGYNIDWPERIWRYP